MNKNPCSFSKNVISRLHYKINMKQILLAPLAIIVLLLTSFHSFAQNATLQVISGTVSGEDDFVDDVTASSARYNTIISMCTDSAGNTYLLDLHNYRIRKIDAVTHIVTTIAGNGTPGFSGDGGPAVLAEILQPQIDMYYYDDFSVGGICCDKSGNVYLADFGNGRIRRIDHTTGTITTVAGGGEWYNEGALATDVDIRPSKVCIDKYNNLYFSDSKGSINKVSATTHRITTLEGITYYGHYNDYPNYPSMRMLVCDKWGNLIVSGYAYDANTTLIKIDTSGSISHIAGVQWNWGMGGADGRPASNQPFNSISDIAVDTSGNIYLAEFAGIRKISSGTGNINLLCGLIHNIAGESTFSGDYPYIPTYGTFVPADSAWMSYSGSSVCVAPSGQLLFTGIVNSGVTNYSVNTLLQYNPPGFSVESVVVKDSLITPPCQLPAIHHYSIKGTLNGTPGATDSIYFSIFFPGMTDPSIVNLPYYSFIDSSGATIFGFGDDTTNMASFTYSFPAINTANYYYTTKHGTTDLSTNFTVSGTVCDSNITDITLYSFTDSLTTPPCSLHPQIRINIEGAARGTPSASDSAYIVINFGDGTSELKVVTYDTESVSVCYGTMHNHFRCSTLHTYPTGFTGNITPSATCVTNAGTAQFWPGGGPSCSAGFPVVHVYNCSVPGVVSDTLIPSDTNVIACSLPLIKSFAVGSKLTNAEITHSSVTYYLNYGDGSDTTVTLAVQTDGLGNFFTKDTFAHNYTMPGAYTVAITPADSAHPTEQTTFTIGTSCSPVSGVFYRDGNANCTPDTHETRLAYWPMAVINTTVNDTTYAWCDSAGHYSLSLINGDTYSLVPNYFATWGTSTSTLSLSCPASGAYTITPSAGSTYVQDFGFTCPGMPDTVDMNLAGFAWGIIPGDTGVVGIWSSNDWGYMCDSLNSTVTLTLDPLLTYVGMWDGPAPTTVSGSTLTWNFHTQANLLDFHADVKVRCATTATMGASVCNTLHVTPTSFPDPDTANNTYNWCQPVRSSWDPNEKEVSPKGFGPEGYILNGTPLTYTVHFQNTGTARARNITINDTISEHLDIATLQVVSSSAPVLVYQPELTGNLIKFRFNDINLPDSGTDFNGSNGYVVYNIYPKADLAPGTHIQNTAGIYFDYNPAVITNTTTNTIEYDLTAISGGSDVCEAATLPLSNSIAGGVWSASNGHATISATGLLTGISAGVDTIWYTTYGGDQKVFKVITINTLPVVSVTTGITSVCVAATTTLSNTTTGGSWTSSSANTTVSGGVVTGVTAGTSIISYSITNSCGTATDTMLVTINPLPDAGTITGIPSVCAAAATTLYNTITGGTWTSSTANATVAGGTVTGVTAGTSIISYAVTNACGIATDTMLVTVNPLPDAGTITGTPLVCEAAVTTLGNSSTGGSWTSSTAHATVSGGIVTGLTTGTSIISYSVTNGCGTATDTMLVSVESLPNAGTITGISNVCAGSTITLNNAVSGGTWSSGTLTHATVTGGIVTGVAAGSSIISYAISNICGTAADTLLFTVNPLPDAGTITGTNHVCVGGTITLSNTATGGTWLPSTSTADVTDGVVTGMSAGGVVIFYTVTNTCGTAEDTMAITINALPDAGTITGTTTICNGAGSTLTASISGGAWSSSNAATVSVDASGNISGISAGTATISYLISNECGADTATTSINVVNLPNPGTISGADTVCPGAAISLSASVGSGTWSSSDNTLASVSSSGVVTGVGAGSVTISYQVSNVCGPNTATYTVTVLPLTACPDNISDLPIATDITLYPNPNDGTFTIAGTWPGSDRTVSIEIVNVLGQIAYSNTATVTNGELKVLLQTTNLAAGTYLVRLADGKQLQTLRCTISQ